MLVTLGGSASQLVGSMVVTSNRFYSRIYKSALTKCQHVMRKALFGT